MEQTIGLLLIGGSLYVLAALHNDARTQGWRWPAQVALYGSGGAILALAILVTLGSTDAARMLFVGFAAVLIIILLLFSVLALASAIVALRDRSPGP